MARSQVGGGVGDLAEEISGGVGMGDASLLVVVIRQKVDEQTSSQDQERRDHVTKVMDENSIDVLIAAFFLFIMGVAVFFLLVAMTVAMTVLLLLLVAVTMAVLLLLFTMAVAMSVLFLLFTMAVSVSGLFLLISMPMAVLFFLVTMTVTVLLFLLATPVTVAMTVIVTAVRVTVTTATVRVAMSIAGKTEDDGAKGVDRHTKSRNANVPPAGSHWGGGNKSEDGFQGGVETQSQKEHSVDQASENFRASPSKTHIEGAGAFGGLIGPIGDDQRDNIREIMKTISQERERVDISTNAKFKNTI